MKRRAFLAATAGVAATAGCTIKDEDGDTQVGRRTGTPFDARLGGESRYATDIVLEQVTVVIKEGYAFVVELAPEMDSRPDRAAIRRDGDLINSLRLFDDDDELELVGDYPIYTGTYELQFINRHGNGGKYREIVETVPIEVTKG